jgi:hypothetical protein
MLTTDTAPASTILVTITSPDGSVETFESTPTDAMLVCLGEWFWL